MDHDSCANSLNTGSGSFSYGAVPSWMDRQEHSPYQGANLLDLPSAIAHELQRSQSSTPGWQYYPSQEDAALGILQQQQGAFVSQNVNLNGSRGLALPPYYIPRFEEALGPASSGLQDYSSCSPWIERMMQADVTPTPSPSFGVSTSLSLNPLVLGEVSCVASAGMDSQSDLHHERELSADLCSDDEDLETRPVDEKRKRRMLSNRASAQRSRQRRQERLDELEVLTAQLRVENSTLQKKLSAAIHVAKKLEDQNTNLLNKVDILAGELDTDKPTKDTDKLTKDTAAAAAPLDECASSQQTTCASELVGGQTSVDPTLMRDSNENDGASSPSMSAGTPGSPSDMDFATSDVNNYTSNKAELSPVRRSFSACRVGQKRSLGESGIASSSVFGGSRSAPIGSLTGAEFSRPTRPRPSPPGGFPESSFSNSFGLEPTLETDQWLEFY